MSKQLYTLIHGDRIHTAPKEKIIPAEDFSTLQNALEVLELIKEDAEKYRLQVAQESEKIKENAYLDGYEEGLSQWAEHLAAFEKKVEELQGETEKSILPIALMAAKKIVGREIELSEETVVDIVAANLKPIAQHKKILIYVNKRELDILEKHKPRLREIFENLEAFSIRPRDDIARGGCIIETEIGIINAQMEHRWHILERAFEGLLNTHPHPPNPG